MNVELSPISARKILDLLEDAASNQDAGQAHLTSVRRQIANLQKAIDTATQQTRSRRIAATRYYFEGDNK
jgi:hypothetical protein